jgi:hydrogenase/urease accessory protein HupE
VVNRIRVVAGAERLDGRLTPQQPSATLPVALAVWEAGAVLPHTPSLPPQPEDLTRGYFSLGFLHVVTGYDHLAFLAGLLLLAPSFGRLAVLITAFTLAHSLTLSASALGVVAPPAAMAETAIALSVAYVGLENLVLLRRRSEHRAAARRWCLSFGFGLIHGFGFAYLLTEIGLPEQGLLGSLLLFNLGVETGQVLVCVAPLAVTIWLVRRWSGWRSVLTVGSFLVMTVGLYWAAERALSV